MAHGALRRGLPLHAVSGRHRCIRPCRPHRRRHPLPPAGIPPAHAAAPRLALAAAICPRFSPLRIVSVSRIISVLILFDMIRYDRRYEMARAGVSYEQVAAAADSLVGAGQQPTIRSVRERLGDTGSPNTIHKHLTAWRSARPVAPAAAPELPPALTAAFAQELSRAAAAVRGEIESRLVQAQAEATELAAAGEALEAERDSLIEQVAALTRERDVQAGVTAQQAADLGEAQRRVEREQEAAENARLDAAKTRLRLEALDASVKAQEAEIGRLGDDLRKAHQDLIRAERDAAVTHARLEATQAQIGQAEDRATKAEEATARAERVATEAAHAAEGTRAAAEKAQAEQAQALAAAAADRERAARWEGQAAVAEEKAARAAHTERLATEAAQAADAARAAAEKALQQAQSERDEAKAAAAEARERAARLEGRLKALEEAAREAATSPT